MRRFIVGDIHGSYLALVQVLERCGFDYENDLLITIGDIIDGWEDSFRTVEHLLTIKNRIDIIGNHDNFFRTFIELGIHEQAWGLGGLSTAKSYANAIGLDLKVQDVGGGWIVNLNNGDIPEEHKKFFKGQHKYYKDQDNNLFVHGGFNPRIPINEQLGYNLMWDRHLWSKHLSIRDSKMKMIYEEDFNKIFIGHTSTTFCGSYEPVTIDKLTNTDTGAGGGGYLSIVDIDSGEFWQSDYVPDLYPDDPHHIDNQ
jgi:serine/threonine protein phosphatase 1